MVTNPRRGVLLLHVWRISITKSLQIQYVWRTGKRESEVVCKRVLGSNSQPEATLTEMLPFVRLMNARSIHYTHTHTHMTFTGTAHTSTPLHQWAEMEGLTPGGCGIVIRDWTNTARPRLLLSRVSSAELWAEGVCPCQSCNYITAHVVVGQQKPPTKNKKTEKLACVWRCVWRERTDKDTVTLYQAEGGPLPVVIRVCVYLHDRCFTWCVWLQHVCVQFPGLGGS